MTMSHSRISGLRLWFFDHLLDRFFSNLWSNLVICCSADPFGVRLILFLNSPSVSVVDLEEAFHRVPRKVICWVMHKSRVDKGLIWAIMAMYVDARTVAQKNMERRCGQGYE